MFRRCVSRGRSSPLSRWPSPSSPPSPTARSSARPRRRARPRSRGSTRTRASPRRPCARRFVALEQAAAAGRADAEVTLERLCVPPPRSVAPRGSASYASRSRAELAELLSSTRATPNGLPEAVVARLALGPASPVSGAVGTPAVEVRLLAGELPVRPEDLPYLGDTSRPDDRPAPGRRSWRACARLPTPGGSRPRRASRDGFLARIASRAGAARRIASCATSCRSRACSSARVLPSAPRWWRPRPAERARRRRRPARSWFPTSTASS